MTHIEMVAVTAQATFGRDGAMFNSLLDFVAQLSVVLWGMVVLTAVIRFAGIRMYRRGAGPAAHVETVAPIAVVPAAVVPTTDGATNAPFDEIPRPAKVPAVAASVNVPHHSPRSRRAEHRSAEHRSATHVPSLAANSMEA